jgi:hypothetical protein
MRRRLWAVGLLLALAAVSGGVVAASGVGGTSGQSAAAANRTPLRFEQHELYIEYNATDGDAGLQLAADAEDWKRFTLLDTDGKVLIEVGATGRLRRPFGLSELFLEASEPPFTRFHSRRSRSASRKARTASGESRATAGGWWDPIACPSWSRRRRR